MNTFRIFLDMDEVLADFVGGVCDLFGVSRELVESYWAKGEWDMVPPLALALNWPGFGKKNFWDKIREEGKWFWAGLKPTKWAEEIVSVVEEASGGDWFIVSAPSRSTTSRVGKIFWSKSKLDMGSDRLILTPHKYLFSKEGTILIDDRESTVEKFREAGGLGIVFPARHNSLHERRHDPVEYVREQLENIRCT